MQLPPILARVGPAVARRVLTANAIGAVLAFVYFSFLAPGSPAPLDGDRDSAITGIVFVAYVAFAFPVAAAIGGRITQPVQRWVREQRDPDDAERRATLAVPGRIATLSLANWTGAAVVFSGLNVIFGNTAGDCVGLFVGILLVGLTTSAIAYLLVERTMRPVFALVMPHVRETFNRNVGIRPRILLTWLLGSGVPLLLIALSSLAYSDEGEGELRLPVLFLAVVSLLVGSAIMRVAARSIADPVRAVRKGLERVEAGDPAVEVEVNDAGEVGVLQAGFNRMVGGLREREQLRELFGRHVGDEVAQLALEHASGLASEQRDASVLFVDMIGSSAMAEVLPPVEVVQTLNDFFSAVVDAVAAEGGWVNKFEGDGALCVFGAPGDQPDHARRALRAARALRERLIDLGGEHPGFDAAIGVSSGAVVAGNVGTERRYEYTVIGRPVNEASRLTDLAKGRPGRVLASAAAVERAGDEADRWASLGTVALRGHTAPTALYEPTAGVSV
jgi:adenylate cyclase